MSFDDLLSESTKSELLHTDSDIAIEDEIEMHSLQLDEYQEKTSTFKLGPSNYKMKDPQIENIFNATGPNKEKRVLADCASCKVFSFTKEK
jgi:hypothetical protein